jgi:SAM-dependent methyltransferase
MSRGIRRLAASEEEERTQFSPAWPAFASRHGLSDWEGWFHPYDGETHQFVLQHVGLPDTVLDIGAGDLRLALELAPHVQRVYALEVNPLLVARTLQETGLDLPRNVHVICANALDVAIPLDVTVAVLLMRHCQHFQTYLDRLQLAGCRRLITNARWRSGVEVIDLAAPRVPLAELKEGWYACWCGAVGYAGQGDRAQAAPTEVRDCPACRRASEAAGGDAG